MSRLYLRLLLWFVVANIVTLLVSVYLTQRIARHAMGDDPDWSEYAQQANTAYIAGGTAALDQWLRAHDRRGIEMTLMEGRRNLSSQRLPIGRLLPQMLESESVEFRPRPGLRFIGQRAIGSDGVPRHLVVVRHPGTPPRPELLLVVQIALSILVIAVVGWWLARSIARPIAAVREAARRFANGDLAARVPAHHSGSRDEVGDLARDFDRMAARIETLVTTERGVLQDVSHELRSPLARLHLLLDMARRSGGDQAAPHFDRAEHEIGRLDELIGQALALSRLESGLPGEERQPVELLDLVRERVADWQLQATERGVRLDLLTTTSVVVPGSAMLIGRAVDNLLSNAIKFSDRGGCISVDWTIDAVQTTLRVRDQGPGVPEADLPRLFRPFFRGGNAARADGHGLGLAIVQRVATAHGGRVDAVNIPGGGLEVSLQLPR